MLRTVKEAQKAVRSEPKRWRMALCEAPGVPILDHDDCKVTLYATKKRAQEELRTRTLELESQGWTRNFGTLARGVLMYELAGATMALGLDYAGRRTDAARG